MPKIRVVEIGCGSFDQPNLQSQITTNFTFSFFDCNLIFLGRVIYHWTSVFKTFPIVYYMPPTS